MICYLYKNIVYKKSELNKMCKLGDGMAITGKNSMDERIAREGRPYGGCAILWKLSLESAVKELKCNYVRLCGIMIKINCEIMCLNVYVPCDGWSEHGKFAEYMEVLSEIQQLIHTYNPAHVIYGGDMITDLTRNTPHAYALRNFISDFNLTVCIDTQVPYTYVSPNGLTSRIDNFLTTENIGQKVLECAIIDNLLFSDHVPLKVRFDINVDHMFERNYCRKLAWHKASTELINQYSSDLEYKLSMLQYDEEALLCKNAMCKKHDNELSRVYNYILNMCIESSEYIHTTCPKTTLIHVVAEGNFLGGLKKLNT